MERKKKGGLLRFSWLIGLSVLLIGLGVLWQLRGGSREEEEGARFRVTFLSDLANAGYWGRAADGAVKTAGDYGAEVQCLGSLQMDTEKLLQNLEGAIYSDVDGIITYGLGGSERFEGLLQEAAARGIPVVLIDSDVPASLRLCYVGTDNEASGYLAGEEMARRCGREGRILAVTSYRDKGNQADRLKGFSKALAAYPGMELVRVLECASDPILSRSRIQKALQEDPQIAGIFCTEGVSSRACTHLMSSLGEKERKHVILYDYSPMQGEALREGWIDACIQQDSRRMGELAMEILGRYLTEGEVPEERVYTQMFLISASTLEDASRADYGRAEVEWHYY